MTQILPTARVFGRPYRLKPGRPSASGGKSMSWIRRVAMVASLALFVAVTPSAAFAGKATKGGPVTIYTIGEYEVAAVGSSNPEVSGAVEARAEAINKAGGLKDATGATHHLEVVVCNTNLDPNRAE